MKKIGYIFTILTFLGKLAFGQSFTAKASKTTVAVGERFQISFSLNSSGDNFQPPELTYFDVYSGPNQSTSMSYVNGSMTQSVSLSYVIAAKKEGKFSIGPASVRVGGNTVRSNSLNIDVVKASQQASTNGQQAAAENTSNQLFVKTIVDKRKAYQGEEITVTHKVYTRYQLRGFQDIKFPDYNGFWTEDYAADQQVQLNNEIVDGVTYQVGVLRRTYIFPQRSGKLTIGSLKVDCVIRKKSGRQPRDVFEQFFGGGYEDAVVSVSAPATTINVLPLPEENKPEGFSGAVGKYSYKATLSKEEINANDAVNLKITLSGSGNLKLLSPQKINFPEDFETYDPKIKENISAGANGVSGSKSFDYLIIPRHEGAYEIKELDFSFFDPQKKKYISLPAPVFKLKVNKGSGEAPSGNLYSSINKEDVKLLGNDIRYIKTNEIKLQPKNHYFYGSPLFYTGIMSPIFAFIAFLLVRKKHIEKNKDFISVKSRKANKVAKKRLAIAEQHLKSDDKEKFYLEILNAMHGYLENKLNIAAADLNKENISNMLKQRQVTDGTIQKVLSTIDTCEYARYAPSAVSGNCQSIYSETAELITKIENELK